jgi:hypothetical protein
MRARVCIGLLEFEIEVVKFVFVELDGKLRVAIAKYGRHAKCNHGTTDNFIMPA